MITSSPGIEKLLKEEKMEDVPCPICHAEGKKQNDKVVATYGYPNVHFQNVICKNCALTRINPRMTIKGYDRFYKEVFFEYLDPYGRPAYVEEIEQTTNDRFWTPTRKWLMPYILPWVKEGSKVLDIGAGFGSVLYYLKKEKNTVGVGLEPDPESAKIAKEKIGIELLDETVESYFAKNNDIFDFIVLNQTYEHLLNPLETLKQLKERLTPEGLIYIGVPNGYRFGAPFYLFFQLAHTYNYTPYSFKKLAALAGLKVVNVRDPRRHPLEVLLSHPDANTPTERDEVLSVGQDYKDVIWEMRKKKYRENVRAVMKSILTKLFGPKIKESIRKIIDKTIRYRY